MSKKAIFEKKNVLVIGGAGFIGSHLCDELIKTCKVICVDDFSTGQQRNIDHLLAEPDFAFIRHDMSSPIDLENEPALQKFKIQFQGIQEIYNLACPMSPKNFKKNIPAILLANSFVVKSSLDLAVKHEAKLLFFSSSVVYGPRRNDNEKIKEGDIGAVDFLSERGAYDEGKRFAETMIKNYRDALNIDAKIIRVFRTYGPRMMLNDDQMIPDFIRDALDNKDLVIYGDENFHSSFCYVSDVVDAALKIMETDAAGPINIGSDVDVNFTDLAKKIIAKTSSSSQIKYEEPRLFMTPLCLPDIGKASSELGWMPIATLDRGLDRTIDDLRASKGLKGIGDISDV
ncbi:NAD-dependent epimerase/dehydratase family protein [Candidatus Falkowbacteria bacterium]|nr:NAD-dependent epimerase/dehydratase family protein [Candidatus Falkowbacteria bacterium]